tara:strand:+ start:10826 stop:11482 length:657 start_codon:yes stop_codon:yes gene_type:complete
VNIVIFGPPGAGKGTQSDKIVEEFKLFKLSAGDILREQIKKNNKSELSNKINEILNRGSLVPDNIIDKLVEEIIANKKYNNQIIFDGYPRNINQAKTLNLLLNKYNQKISCVLNLKVEKDVIVKRILGREVCSKCGNIFNKFFYPANKNTHGCDSKFLEKRSDDNEETVIKRLETYTDITSPILDYYEKQNLLTIINGMNKIDDIYKEIRQIIRSLKT